MAQERAAEWTDASAAALVDYLEGIQYPCTKAEMIDHMRRRGAPETVIQALERIADQQYYDLAQVMDWFSKVNP